ncbi:hypothetical protein GCM10023219_30500 [Stakelama sediminis]|uniref:peptidylprolyl isomerase n=1 Tax=Stakelama sediminis TaxID=463200 RepID=A0A840Z2R4_9SPHN|nr:peptidylprolyl isomerase [Stakelama sediminis]MBB5720044.1 peptidylprolyl isomerase [Stakelama sediminis]
MRLIAFLLAVFAAVGITAAPASAQMFKTDNNKNAPKPTDKDDLWILDLSTGGRVTILLRPDVAPKMVARVKKLTREHFYDGTIFHRVMDQPLPIAQGGDPTGTGTGGSKLPDVPAEFNYLPHVRGAVSAARAQDKNSANSQFFILFQPALELDKKYTVFGRVISGMQWVDKIHRGQPPADPSRILHAYIGSDNPPPYQPAPAVTPANNPDANIVLPGIAPAKKQPADSSSEPKPSQQ